MEFLSWLNFGWVGSLIGIMGFISGIVFFIKSNKKIIPCYQFMTSTIVGVGKNNHASSKDIEITFQGKKVENVKRTIVAIWNDGNKYLDRSIIVVDNPLKIKIPDGEILSHQIKSKSSDSIIVNAEKENKNSIIIDFNYLDSKEGLCIELLHTSNKNEPEISCTIKGIKNGFLNKGKIITISNIKAYGKFKYIIPIAGSIIFLVGLASLNLNKMRNSGQENLITRIDDLIKQYDFTKSVQETSLNGWIMMAGGIIYILLPMLMKFIYRAKIPKNLDVS